MDKKSSEYKLIRMADTSFLFCIIFEVVGIMTVMFLGILGAQMAIYFMAFFSCTNARNWEILYGLEMQRKSKRSLNSSSAG